MTERIPLAQHTKASLDQLYAEVDRLTAELADYDERTERLAAELRRYTEAESADAAAGSYAGRVQELEAVLASVRQLHQPIADDSGPSYCQTCTQEGTQPQRVGWWVPYPCPTVAALDSVAPAIAQPEPWLRVDFTSPDPTTANTSALSLRDHLTAEFPGVGMRISSNAVEGEPILRDPCPLCESSPTLIPRQLMDEHVATVHPEVQMLDTTPKNRSEQP
ncbi:hypothetical protein STRTUCAR8_08597 [Streptomyces turgidiscabies Car8]|uniref:Uncharacterized protein n=1 Tax=Streptomyces turgidiscabies (strain Car8) TaxID=698760 RepID=L7F940_STRT8|nr:hypothetical protein [Streptomyces turgidiscabies]ELP67619.1 hypothetical protein STRTUCAR8_08597 [Streptomyces turgidiscabies Car8]